MLYIFQLPIYFRKLIFVFVHFVIFSAVNICRNKNTHKKTIKPLQTKTVDLLIFSSLTALF